VATEDDDEDEHVTETVAELGLVLERPEWWEVRIDDHGSHRTFTCWDEYTGTFRISPKRVSETFRPDEFLESERERRKGEWRTYGALRFVCYEEDSDAGDHTTHMHYYLAGTGEHLLVCSFAYAAELLDDEFSADEVEGALEEVEKMLHSLRFTP
jgi:hypothetical protein